MIDIQFYLHIAEYKRRLMAGENLLSKASAFEFFESCRSRVPVIFNIESTNACNATCFFCPRTTLMTRPVKTMSNEVYQKVVNQLYPHNRGLWQRWENFARKEYGIPLDEQSENAFFLYILPRVVVLHGYGDPLLDPHIQDRVGMLTDRGIPSYFSCNPANIKLDRIEKTFENGLSYIKFSVDSATNNPARGLDNYLHDMEAIRLVLELKERRKYQTQIIVTMIDLGKRGQKKEYKTLQKAFEGTGVYLYLKSADQSWLTGKEPPKSIHWREFCQFPWSSMSVNSSGLVVPCGEDVDSSMILGDAKFKSLKDIWNGPKYEKFRHTHFDITPGLWCMTCEMKKVGQMI